MGITTIKETDTDRRTGGFIYPPTVRPSWRTILTDRRTKCPLFIVKQ